MECKQCKYAKLSNNAHAFVTHGKSVFPPEGIVCTYTNMRHLTITDEGIDCCKYEDIECMCTISKKDSEEKTDFSSVEEITVRNLKPYLIIT